MNILLTNDDGVFAPGIIEIGKMLIRNGHNVIIFAPNCQNSGKSHSITIFEELNVKQVEIEGLNCTAYSVDGTPADCVRVANVIYKDFFDFCFSGCNIGYNAGLDIIYSGTVSAAFEANSFGIPSIAISSDFGAEEYSYEAAVKVAEEIFNKYCNKFKEPLVLNINVPSIKYSELKGIKSCIIDGAIIDKYHCNKTENGYKLKVYARNKQKTIENSDRYYLERGYASLTPLTYNYVNEKILNSLKEYK